jgi:hypothetical protein
VGGELGALLGLVMGKFVLGVLVAVACEQEKKEEHWRLSDKASPSNTNNQ